MSQSFTLIDVAGNQAQYTIHDRDRNSEFYWSTSQGDHGVAVSFEKAQYNARAVLKESMTASRRREETAGAAKYASPWR